MDASTSNEAQDHMDFALENIAGTEQYVGSDQGSEDWGFGEFAEAEADDATEESQHDTNVHQFVSNDVMPLTTMDHPRAVRSKSFSSLAANLHISPASYLGRIQKPKKRLPTLEDLKSQFEALICPDRLSAAAKSSLSLRRGSVSQSRMLFRLGLGPRPQGTDDAPPRPPSRQKLLNDPPPPTAATLVVFPRPLQPLAGATHSSSSASSFPELRNQPLSSSVSAPAVEGNTAFREANCEAMLPNILPANTKTKINDDIISGTVPRAPLVEQHTARDLGRANNRFTHFASTTHGAEDGYTQDLDGKRTTVEIENKSIVGDDVDVALGEYSVADSTADAAGHFVNSFSNVEGIAIKAQEGEQCVPVSDTVRLVSYEGAPPPLPSTEHAPVLIESLTLNNNNNNLGATLEPAKVTEGITENINACDQQDLEVDDVPEKGSRDATPDVVASGDGVFPASSTAVMRSDGDGACPDESTLASIEESGMQYIQNSKMEVPEDDDYDEFCEAVIAETEDGGNNASVEDSNSNGLAPLGGERTSSVDSFLARVPDLTFMLSDEISKPANLDV